MLQRDLQHWDSSGVPQTCRNIDKVINFLYSVEGGDDFIYLMEEIRSNNEQLREHGAQVNWDLTDRIDDLEYDLQQANDKIRDLESDLSHIN
jgi:hypothetical protein